MLSQRMRTAIEVNGADGLVSSFVDVFNSRSLELDFVHQTNQNYAETLQRPLKTYRIGFTIGGSSTDEPEQDTYISYSKAE